MQSPDQRKPFAATTTGSTPPDRATVMNLIHSDRQNLAQLELLLKQEKQALAQRDHQNLQALLDEKKQLLTVLAKNAQARTQLLNTLALEDNAENWRQLVGTLQLETLWQELESQLKRCRELNNINDIIIHRTRQTVGAILNALRGKTASTETYSQKGATVTATGVGRPIVSA